MQIQVKPEFLTTLLPYRAFDLFLAIQLRLQLFAIFFSCFTGLGVISPAAEAMDVTARCTSRGDAVKMGEELRSHQKGSCPATVSILVHPHRGRSHRYTGTATDAAAVQHGASTLVWCCTADAQTLLLVKILFNFI